MGALALFAQSNPANSYRSLVTVSVICTICAIFSVYALLEENKASFNSKDKLWKQKKCVNFNS